MKKNFLYIILIFILFSCHFYEIKGKVTYKFDDNYIAINKIKLQVSTDEIYDKIEIGKYYDFILQDNIIIHFVEEQ